MRRKRKTVVCPACHQSRIAKKGDRRLCCSKKCQTAFYRGDRSHSWIDGRDKIHRNYRGLNWEALAASIRKRDKYRCVACGKTQEENGQALDVNHIEPWHNFTNKRLANRRNNLESLCKSCHIKKDAKAIIQLSFPFFRERRNFGSKHPSAKLQENDVILMRQLFAEGATKTELARKFKVSDTTVNAIVTGEKWKHLPMVLRQGDTPLEQYA